MTKLNFETPAYEWMPFQNQQFCVSVRCWKRDDKFCWNVYACIYEGHPLHGDPEAAMGLHLHGGATYDKYITTEPSQGIKYDWQKAYRTLKVGSDYQHLYDDWAAICDPSQGIPHQIQSDVRELVEQLLSLQQAKA